MGKCLIFSAPSGAGKTTLVHYLLNELDNLAFSVSACSRDPRTEEKDGIDYHFLSVEEFKQKIENDDFVEWEEVYENNFYGTLKSEVEKSWAAGKMVLFDVDVEGGINLKNYFGDQAMSIFIHPPSIKILEQRLRNRKTDSEENIKRRLAKASQELSKAAQFDTILINDELQEACIQLKLLTQGFQER
ncbi:guanylate kinase [Crocinitomix catalasitica]|nr:guanylate kinase [Crocinitomix catalasitica]